MRKVLPFVNNRAMITLSVELAPPRLSAPGARSTGYTARQTWLTLKEKSKVFKYAK